MNRCRCRRTGAGTTQFPRHLERAPGRRSLPPVEDYWTNHNYHSHAGSIGTRASRSAGRADRRCDCWPPSTPRPAWRPTARENRTTGSWRHSHGAWGEDHSGSILAAAAEAPSLVLAAACRLAPCAVLLALIDAGGPAAAGCSYSQARWVETPTREPSSGPDSPLLRSRQRQLRGRGRLPAELVAKSCHQAHNGAESPSER